MRCSITREVGGLESYLKARRRHGFEVLNYSKYAIVTAMGDSHPTSLGNLTQETRNDSDQDQDEYDAYTGGYLQGSSEEDENPSDTDPAPAATPLLQTTMLASPYEILQPLFKEMTASLEDADDSEIKATRDLLQVMLADIQNRRGTKRPAPVGKLVSSSIASKRVERAHRKQKQFN